jgi:hypothetical protein
VPAIIKDESGVENSDGLIPRSAVDDDLEFIVEAWQPPDNESPNYVQVGWRLEGQPFLQVNEYQFWQPIDNLPKIMQVPFIQLEHGTYELSYKVIVQGNSVESLKKKVTVDRRAPDDGQSPGPFEFPAEVVLAGAITDDYLNQYGEVEMTVPRYTDMRGEDKVIYYWTEKNPPPSDEVAVGEKVFSQDEIDNGILTFALSEALIRTAGQGRRYAYYRLQDLAGNVSDVAIVAGIEVLLAEASGVGYQQNQQGISLGADAPLPFGDGQWLIGGLVGYSKSDLDLSRGTSGTVKSSYIGAYTTWLDQDSGYYFDGLLKLNRFNNESKVSMSDGTRAKGDYDNLGLGGSLEFGRHIKLDNGYFVEPFTQLSAVVIEGKDYGLNNGMEAEGDRTRSLLGKVGMTAGRNFTLASGTIVQPYARVAMAHEFAKNNEVQVNNNVFNNDLSGSRGELGAGLAAALTDRLQVHADFDYSNGEHIEQPFGANVGVRYSW